MYFAPFAYAYISITETNKRTDYWGKEMAKQIELVWSKKYENKIDLVIGNEWYAGNFSYHLSSRPKWIGSTKGIFQKILKGDI